MPVQQLVKMRNIRIAIPVGGHFRLLERDIGRFAWCVHGRKRARMQLICQLVA